MRSLTKLFTGTRTHLTLAASLVALGASACAGGDPLTGTWSDPDATTPLPAELGGGDLGVDATLVLDDSASPGTFDLHIALSFEGLTDTVDLQGTYVDAGSELTLEPSGFTIDPASGNTASVAEDGSQCIILQGFAGAGVCFPSPQTNPYVLAGDTLDVTIDQAIAGAAVSQTHLALTRAQ